LFLRCGGAISVGLPAAKAQFDAVCRHRRSDREDEKGGLEMSRKKKIALIGSGAFVALCLACLICGFAQTALRSLGVLPTLTAKPSRTAIPAATSRPIVSSPISSATVSDTENPVETVRPSDTSEPTAIRTATQEATETEAGIAATQKPPCDCGGPDLDCKDFASHAQAQACFDFCGGTANDVFRLDGDGDGRVCE
jgi:hypothetical protein